MKKNTQEKMMPNYFKKITSQREGSSIKKYHRTINPKGIYIVHKYGFCAYQRYAGQQKKVSSVRDTRYPLYNIVNILTIVAIDG